ncbi:MAG TPA: hypothetical protein VGM84_00050 [Steroidobacteraceae bacterium]|jgi:hypothetical protein
MESFAQRMGLRPVRSLVQKDTLDAETRTELWNVTYNMSNALAGSRTPYGPPTTFNNVTASIWAWEFNHARDEQPRDSALWGLVKERILKGAWVDVLDMIEATVGYVKRFENYDSEDVLPAFIDIYNSTFETLLVGYRFIDNKLIPIDSEAEIQAIKSGLDDTRLFKGARHHLDQAAAHLADRTNPDYPNSIKESISAVESICVAVTHESTLGAALKKLQKAGVSLHPALEGAWLKMYGWTSDADGIRHGSIDAPNADQALAKYMLVACSAFVSYVIEASRKANLV